MTVTCQYDINILSKIQKKKISAIHNYSYINMIHNYIRIVYDYNYYIMSYLHLDF